MRQLSTCLVTLTALAACGEESPSPTEVRTAIRSDLAHVLTEAKAASDGSTANLPSTAMFESFIGAQEPTVLSSRLLDVLDSARSMQLRADDAEAAFDPEAITKMLEEQLFTDANHLGDGIYRVPASLVCETTDFDTGEPTIDPECAANLTKIQLRVRVASQDETLAFFVQVTDKHDEPLSFSLSHDRLAVTVNLDEASSALSALSQLEGGQPSSAKLSGSVTGSVTILGDDHAKLALDFDRAISVEFDGAKFTSAVAKVIAVDLDGKATKAALSVALGETTAHMPGDQLDPQARDFFLAGLSVDASLEGNALSLSNISLGNKTTTFKVGGQQALAIDLNPNDGRKLSATLVADTLTVSPRFDLQMAMNRALLDAAPAAYDVTRVFLEGALRGNEHSGVLKVMTGTFAITTNPAQYGFSATAGQCVTSLDEGFSVGACTLARDPGLGTRDLNEYTGADGRARTRDLTDYTDADAPAHKRDLSRYVDASQR